MDIEKGWVVVLCIAIAVACLLLGWAAGGANISDDCNKLGRFSFGGKVYECSPQGKPADGAK